MRLAAVVAAVAASQFNSVAADRTVQWKFSGLLACAPPQSSCFRRDIVAPNLHYSLLRLTALALLAGYAIRAQAFDTIINLPDDPAPGSVGSNTQLNVWEAGHLPSSFLAPFQAGSSRSPYSSNVEVNIAGGTVGPFLRANRSSVVTLSSGSIDRGFDATPGSKVTIAGGSVGEFFAVWDDSVADVVGGVVGDNFEANDGSIVNISGGQVLDGLQVEGALNLSGGAVGDRMLVNDGGEVTFSGGAIGRAVRLRSGSSLNIIGTQFQFDGSTSLTAGTPHVVTDRDFTLSGRLADGAPFSFQLNSFPVEGFDYFDLGATVTVTQIDFQAGDYNRDGAVNAADYSVWRDSSDLSVAPGDAADGNFNGVIDHGDYHVWRNHYGDAWSLETTTAPEPQSLLLGVFSLLAISPLKRPFGLRY